MRKKQTNNPLVKKDKDGLPYFVSPNRRTYRQFLAQGLETERVCGERRVNAGTREFKRHRKELAFQYGSKTGKLKKKHFNRMSKENNK
jgi:hypothetical protein